MPPRPVQAAPRPGRRPRLQPLHTRDQARDGQGGLRRTARPHGREPQRHVGAAGAQGVQRLLRAAAGSRQAPHPGPRRRDGRPAPADRREPGTGRVQAQAPPQTARGARVSRAGGRPGERGRADRPPGRGRRGRAGEREDHRAARAEHRPGERPAGPVRGRTGSPPGRARGNPRARRGPFRGRPAHADREGRPRDPRRPSRTLLARAGADGPRLRRPDLRRVAADDERPAGHVPRRELSLLDKARGAIRAGGRCGSGTRTPRGRASRTPRTRGGSPRTATTPRGW